MVVQIFEFSHADKKLYYAFSGNIVELVRRLQQNTKEYSRTPLHLKFYREHPQCNIKIIETYYGDVYPSELYSRVIQLNRPYVKKVAKQYVPIKKGTKICSCGNLLAYESSMRLHLKTMKHYRQLENISILENL